MAKYPPEIMAIIHETNKLRKRNEALERANKDLLAAYQSESSRHHLAYSNLNARYLELLHKDKPIEMAGIAPNPAH